MKSVNKHKSILRAATKVFARKGFFSARISDIAKEAKVADGTIYLYFNNKHDILISVFDEQIHLLQQETSERIKQETDPAEMLSIFISNYLQTMKKSKYLAVVIQRELRQADKKIREYRDSKFAAYLNILVEIVELGQKNGIFRADVNPFITRQLIFGALNEISCSWNTSYESHYSLEQVSSEFIQDFSTGFSTIQNKPISSLFFSAEY